MKHNEPFEDDGRTVADMSGIEHDSSGVIGVLVYVSTLL